MVIGRVTIQESQIFLKLPSQLASTNIVHKAATSVTSQRVIVSGLLASLIIQSENTSQWLCQMMMKSVNMRLVPFHLGYRIQNPEPVDPISLINISGTPELQELIRLLCIEYRDIFSNTLSSQPAPIPPFDLVVQDPKWRV